MSSSLLQLFIYGYSDCSDPEFASMIVDVILSTAVDICQEDVYEMPAYLQMRMVSHWSLPCEPVVGHVLDC